MTDKKNLSIYVIGGLAGAFLGVAISHVLVKSSKSEENSIHLSPQKGLQIGINTIRFARGLLDLLKKT
ncbi:MAG: hypothetical protein C4545_04400 [Anaerolineaceae bacterium]|jgi:hypothetical protein|nr:MAG: hypothetical protein C4545_04400 [Anaerolineaceae bacterium]